MKALIVVSAAAFIAAYFWMPRVPDSVVVAVVFLAAAVLLINETSVRRNGKSPGGNPGSMSENQTAKKGKD